MNICLKVLFLILNSNVAIWENQDVDMGLPIGWYIAQWLANWILTKTDSEQFAVWRLSGGKVSEGLVRRRAEEKKLFVSPC